ncbi:leucine-rich colipase-like protein 1 [Dromiciops gliroides]|uniref:leucine-rich colipase-like protein 1 n=1 Tax=Dromiciops gliroides TaxID=33562 RepID=UPI001CC7DA09|nr:leucine-rich colipase-like protein 1 [Dromiciops gliroides]
MLLGPFSKAGALKLLLTSLLLSQGSMKFHKNIGETCRSHMECYSECCVYNNKMEQLCTRRTIFLQCSGWKKPTGYLCHHPSECKSNCCVSTTSNPRTVCVQRTIFMQCFSWKKLEGDTCSSHEECQSKCCLSTYDDIYHCIPKTGMLIKCLLQAENKVEAEEETTPRSDKRKWLGR